MPLSGHSISSRQASANGAPKRASRPEHLSNHNTRQPLRAKQLKKETDIPRLQTKLLRVDPSSVWFALTVGAHPIAALETKDGCSILLTPTADNTGMSTSIPVSEESAEHGQSLRLAINDNVKGVEQRRGLKDFACFQYSDTLVAY